MAPEIRFGLQEKKKDGMMFREMELKNKQASYKKQANKHYCTC